jgi:hypothetical protein
MRNEIFTTGLTTDYTVQGPTGLTFGTFMQWEDAQAWAKAHIVESSTGELYIMRGDETLEIIQEAYKPLSLKIAGGVCKWCNGRTEVVSMPDGDICWDCSTVCGYGWEVWDYLRG